MKNKSKTKEKSNSVRNYFYMLGFISKNSPLILVVYCLCDILAELPSVLSNVILLKYIIDIVQEGTGYYRIAYALVFFIVVVLTGNFFNTYVYEIFYPKHLEKLYKRMYSQIYDKAAKMDFEAYDNPDFYNDFVLAMNSMAQRTESVINLTRHLVSEIFSISAITAVVATIDPVNFLFIAACVVVIIPASRMRAKVQVNATEAMTPLDRKNLYFSRVFYLQDYAKELRLNPAGEMVERRYYKNIKDRLITFLPFCRQRALFSVCADSLPIIFLINFGVTVFLGYNAIVTKEISLGDFAAAFNGVGSASLSVFNLLTWIVAPMRENGLFIEKFKKFMNTEEKIKDGGLDKKFKKPVSLKLENVSFTYPGSDHATLRNINLEIKPNQKIALVGYNGAGKTTLTNLLLRLYDVTQGKITADGINIKDWNIKSYHENFAAVFQDFSLFGATLAENVAMEDVPDKNRVDAALKESSFSKELPDGTESILLREFDENGVSLSGGEAQKVAVARAFYKDCAFAILDEPSANLDPVSEYSLNEAMARAAKDKTVIFISHRLSTTVMADVIYMLEKGEIVESGSHEELMALNGKYAYMFNLQAEKYNRR